MTLDDFEDEFNAFLASVDKAPTIEQALAYIEHSARDDLDEQHHEILGFDFNWGDRSSLDTSTPDATDVCEIYFGRRFYNGCAAEWLSSEFQFHFGFILTDELRTLLATAAVDEFDEEFSSAQDRELRDQKRRDFIERVRGIKRLWSALENQTPVYSRGQFWAE